MSLASVWRGGRRRTRGGTTGRAAGRVGRVKLCHAPASYNNFPPRVGRGHGAGFRSGRVGRSPVGSPFKLEPSPRLPGAPWLGWLVRSGETTFLPQPSTPRLGRRTQWAAAAVDFLRRGCMSMSMSQTQRVPVGYLQMGLGGSGEGAAGEAPKAKGAKRRRTRTGTRTRRRPAGATTPSRLGTVSWSTRGRRHPSATALIAGFVVWTMELGAGRCM